MFRIDDEVIETRSCSACSGELSVSSDDAAFYEKLGVPRPSACPACRAQTRLQHVNQLHLFKATCAATGKPIITHYPPDSGYAVCSQEHWWSDAVDNCRVGRDIDFSRPFFEQFRELAHAVLRPALFTDYQRDENSAYTNYAGMNKDCYLIFDSDENRDCYYSYGVNGSQNCVDCYRAGSSELCYELVDSRGCYGLAFLRNCESCIDSAFLANCIGCKSCLLCSNLVQKQYHVMNRPVSKEEFLRVRSMLASFRECETLRADLEAFARDFPQRSVRGFQNENVLGNYLMSCKNAVQCFDCRDLYDAKHCSQTFMAARDMMDADDCGSAELIYECSDLGYNAYNIRFSFACLNQIRDLTYCELCFNGCAELFGCVGLKRKQHCILNKQYTPEDYRRLTERLVAHMENTGEWGRYFPASVTSIPYNLSTAQLHFPLTREAAIESGRRWHDPEQTAGTSGATLPDSVYDADDSTLKQTYVCSDCGRGYRIIAQELAFHRANALALPRKCFLCRHSARMSMRTPRRLWERSCDRCQASLQTAFPPDAPDIVYCEGCFLDSLT